MSFKFRQAYLTKDYMYSVGIRYVFENIPLNNMFGLLC